MVRTQVYLPDEMHQMLHQLAKEEKTTFSRLLREGAETVIQRKRKGRLTKQQEALRFFANPPKKYRINLTGKDLVDLIRRERDG